MARALPILLIIGGVALIALGLFDLEPALAAIFIGAAMLAAAIDWSR